MSERASTPVYCRLGCRRWLGQKASRHLTLAPDTVLGGKSGGSTNGVRRRMAENSSQMSFNVHASKPAMSLLTSMAASKEPDKSALGESGNSCLSSVNNGSNFGRFWANSNDQSDDDEAEVQTPMIEEFIDAAASAGYNMQDLIRAEEEIADMEKVSFPSPSSADFRCPLSTKIVKAIVRGKSLKHHGTPWQGSLPKPRISPPKTLGDAVVKNSYIRLRGGQLILKSFKMTLPSNDLRDQGKYITSIIR
jgi:hypothetical protein